MFREIELGADYPHPPERVWRLLTDSAQLARWLMPNDFEPRIGHDFTMRTSPTIGFDGIVHCTVIVLAPPEKMVWRWRAGGMETDISFDLSKTPEGTRLTLRHTGFSGLARAVPWFLMRHGWKKKLDDQFGHALADMAA